MEEGLLGREGSRFWSQARLTVPFCCLLLPAMSQAVQANGTQPLSKTWELSLYELQRTPQVKCAEELAFGQGLVFTLYLLELEVSGFPFLMWLDKFLAVFLRLCLKVVTHVISVCNFLKELLLCFTPGSDHRWLGNCGVTQEPAQ